MSPTPGAAPDRWLEFRVRVHPQAQVEHAAHLLVESGAGAVEERDGTLITHGPWCPDPAAAAEGLKSQLEASLVSRVEVTWAVREHQDWTHLWKQGLSVRHIGARVVVKPTWIPYAARPADVVIEIDPGMAFGTAEHATTRGCLVLLDAVVSAGDRVLDVGTGSAILAIAAAGLGAARVLAVDADPLAVEAARDNVTRNSAGGVTVRLWDVKTDAGATDRFDVVVANMISGLLLPRLPFMRGSLVPGGFLVVGGIEFRERDQALTTFAEQGLEPTREVHEDGWWSACFQVPSDGP